MSDRIQNIQKSRRAFLRGAALAGAAAISFGDLPIRESESNVDTDGNSQGPEKNNNLFDSLVNTVVSRRGFFTGLRIAKAEPLNSGCSVPEGGLNNLVPDFKYCPGPNEALIYATSIIYKESNGRKGYQRDEDRVTGLHVGATYTMRNTANSSETYEVIVNEKGELSRVIEIEGKRVEQTVFVFTADPNTSPYRAANNQPAVEVEFRRHGAWDVDKKEYVLGDPVKAYTALGCTALNYGLRLEERYLGPEDKPVPANAAPQPLVPPVQLPRSGDGSTRTPDLRNLPHITPWPGNGR